MPRLHLALLSAAFMTPACDSAPHDPAQPPEGPTAPLTPGAACLTPSTGALEFGRVLAGQVQTDFVGFESCDGEPVTVSRLGVPDDGDMLLAARIYRPDGTTITPRLPYLLAADETLVVAVTYRARASANDLAIHRTLRLEGDSREVPELPGQVDVALHGQPVTACPDDACGGAVDTTLAWPVNNCFGACHRTPDPDPHIRDTIPADKS